MMREGHIATDDLLSLTPPTGDEVFDQWLKSRALARDRLTKEGSTLYQTIWNRWLAFLTVERIDSEGLKLPAALWHLAKSRHVLFFLNFELRPLKKIEEEAEVVDDWKPPQVSEVTRRRYWTTLKRIYAFAVKRNWVAVNPALDIPESQIPPPEKTGGEILTPKAWAAALASFPQGETLFDIRNRAILSLLFHLDLAPHEVRGLKTSDVIYGGAQGQEIEALAIKGPGPNQNRTLMMPKPAAVAFAAWIEERHRHSPEGADTEVFFSRESTKLSPHALLKLVKDCLVTASENCVLVGPDKPTQMGPQVVRNTLIVKWLEELSILDVVRAAGLKDACGLRYLVHEMSAQRAIEFRIETNAVSAKHRSKYTAGRFARGLNTGGNVQEPS